MLLPRTIAHPVFVNAFLAGLKGAEIAQWHRRGKYLLASLTRTSMIKNFPPAIEGSTLPLVDGGWLGVHLRMTGQLLWLTQDQPLQKHTRVRLWFEQGQELRFVDQRTFGQMWWVPPGIAPATIIPGLKKPRAGTI